MTETAKPKQQEKPIKGREPPLDHALADTFPASDPPSMIQPSVAGSPDHPRRKASKD